MSPGATLPRSARARLRCHERHAAARRARGAAYVEAVILIVFMIIVFAGVQYLASYFNAKQKAWGAARRCAWHFSKNACVMDANIPEDCRVALGGDLEEERNEELYENVKTKQTAAQAPNGSTREVAEEPAPASTPEAALRGGVDTQMRGLLEMIVGQSLNAVVTEDIRRTPTVAAAESQVTVTFYMPCNLKHEDPLQVAKDLFFQLLPGGL